MGQQKKMVEDEEEKQSIAASIAVEAGIVKACRYHDGFFFGGHCEYSKAYKIAAIRLKRGDYTSLFDSQSELTDLIKEFAEEHSYESRCSYCQKLIDE
ncbi:hypothetical protein [Pseudoalteromonas sp.]|uniref:hypothetical protein n=1 Tax=Pseudoalteromonas sp. TaxID=53249 RepID=UPI002354BFC3|nr:hypothetical protein [Pseudoalteromonas sp.]